jgi:hypothetical protein
MGNSNAGTKSLKSECIRPLTPLSLEDARRLIQSYVDHYNTVRLHSAIGYVTPQDMLIGRQAEIHEARDRKLEQARRPPRIYLTVLSPIPRPAVQGQVLAITNTGGLRLGRSFPPSPIIASRLSLPVTFGCRLLQLADFGLLIASCRPSC